MTLIRRQLLESLGLSLPIVNDLLDSLASSDALDSHLDIMSDSSSETLSLDSEPESFLDIGDEVEDYYPAAPPSPYHRVDSEDEEYLDIDTPHVRTPGAKAVEYVWEVPEYTEDSWRELWLGGMLEPATQHDAPRIHPFRHFTW